MDFDDGDSIIETTIYNKDHEYDIKNLTKYTRWFLRILGVWPFVMLKPTKFEKCLATFALPFSSLTMIILVIPIYAHVALGRSDLSELLVMLAPIVFQTTNVIKHFLILFRSGSLRLCLAHMANDWRRVENSNEHAIMRKYYGYGHRLTVACTIFLYSNVVSYNLVLPLIAGSTINEFNETIRPLAFPGTDIFFDPQQDIVYEFVFSSNVFSVFLHFTVNTAMCNLVAIMVSHTCGQIHIITSRLENLVEGNALEENSAVERMAFIVRNHVRLLKFCLSIDDALGEIFLVEVITSSLLICFLAYYCISTWSNSDRVSTLMYVITVIIFSIRLFLYCHIGEILMEQCREVGKSAYMMEWYELPEKINLAVVLIIVMSNEPRPLSAGGMMDLSHETFASIMKTSFAYLNMMRTVA